MYSLIRSLNRKDGGEGVSRSAPRYLSGVAAGRRGGGTGRRPGRAGERFGLRWGGARRWGCCSRRRSAGGRSGASGPSAFMPVWGLGMLVRFTVVGDRGAGGAPVAGRPGRSDARVDGGGPGGPALRRGTHRAPGTFAGRTSMIRFGRTLVLVGTLLTGAGAALAAQAPVIHARGHEIDIAHHLGNAHAIELPFVGEVALPRIAPIHIGGLTHRHLPHQAPRLHAAGGHDRGAGLRAERAVHRAGPGTGPARQGVRGRDGGDGALGPAGGGAAERGTPRRGIHPLPAHALLLHPRHEPPRPAALGRHGHRQHRGHRRRSPSWRSSWSK